jgi:RNA polymerase sigma factor (sigma-70 family)
MTLAQINANISDAELVNLSRAGDRKAFGQIVRRYQALISGLVYAACGDLHQSEDVAQETFISAWKSLSGLREPAKLTGWLCQIARRRLADLSRKTSHKEIQFSQAFTPAQEPAAIPQDVATAEECEMLWRTLARIPQPYRETLVLFYRQEKSTAQVAMAMETTEDSVRQRLTRGRQMLREEVAGLLERNLARTAPTPLFTTQVVAALPALAAQTTGMGATAKAAAAVKGGGLVAILIGWVAPLGFLLALLYGTVQDVRQSKTPRQRRLALLQSILLWIVIAAIVVLSNCVVAIAQTQHWTWATQTFAFSIVGVLSGTTLFSLVTFGRWRMERVLAQEGVNEQPFPQLALWQRLCFTLPVVTLCLGWMVRFALAAGDQTSIELIAAAIIAESLFIAWRLPHLQPARPIQQTFETYTLALLVTVPMLNWRLGAWIATAHGLDINQMPHLLPLWSINLAALILFAWIGTLTYLSRFNRQPVVLPPE